MTQRYARDFKDELGPLFENLDISDITENPESQAGSRRMSIISEG